MTATNPRRKAKVGIMLPIMEKTDGNRSWTELKDMVQLVEAMGFDSVCLPDHFLYKLENNEPAKGCWEAWSMLCAMAACTERVELGTLVLGMGFRNPALLAKMADTLEEISGGRLILGIGAGYHRFEYDAFGYPFDYKYSRFAEGIEILHGLLKNGRVDFEGRFSSAHQCELKPRGPRPNGPPLMMGSKGPKMMKLMGRYCDMWNGFWDDIGNSPEGYAQVKPLIDAACTDVGRDPATLERSVTVLIADETSEPWWEDMPFDNDADLGALKPLLGTPTEIAQSLREFAALGISNIQIHLDGCDSQSIEKLGPILDAFDAA